MSKEVSGSAQHAKDTFVAQLMRSKSRRWAAVRGADPAISGAADAGA